MASTIIAFKGDGCVMVASAGTEGMYYIKFKDDQDTILEIDSNKLLACAGENGDRVNFSEYIKANIQLNRVRSHNRLLSTKAAAHFVRETLAYALRRGPYHVQTMVAGYDTPLSPYDDTVPAAGVGRLYTCDYLGTLQEIPFAAHGYGAPFATALLDEAWRPDLSKQEAVDLMQKCCDEVRKRLIFNAKFTVKVATAQGTETVASIQ